MSPPHNILRFGLAVAMAATGLCLAGCARIPTADPPADTPDIPAQEAVLVIGDSIMAWNEASGESVGNAIDEASAMTAVTRAISGSRILADGHDAIPNQYIAKPWAWVVLNGGGNDLLEACSCDKCDSTLDALIAPDGQSGGIPNLARRATSLGSSVVIVGYFEALDTAAPPHGMCDDEIAELTQRLTGLASAIPQVFAVDGRELVTPSQPALYDEDGIHPSPKGSASIASQVARIINTADSF